MAHKIRCGACEGVHATAAEVRECYAWQAEAERVAAEQVSEIYAEAVMSWVAGGGSPADAGRYAAVVASGRPWDGGVSEIEFSGESCEHGLAKELCCGPQHYPMDDPSDW